MARIVVVARRAGRVVRREEFDSPDSGAALALFRQRHGPDSPKPLPEDVELEAYPRFLEHVERSDSCPQP